MNHDTTFTPVIRESRCTWGFQELVAGRVHTLDIRLAFELITGAEGIAVELQPSSFTAVLVQTPASTHAPRALDRLYREQAPLSAEWSAEGKLTLEGRCDFVPVDMTPGPSELSLIVEYAGRRFFRQLLSVFNVQPFTELLVLRDLVFDRVLRRLSPGWYPIQLEPTLEEPRFTNLVPEFVGVPHIARQRAEADLLRLVTAQLRAVRSDADAGLDGGQAGLVLIKHSPTFPDVSEAALEVTAEPLTHSAVTDYYVGWDFVGGSSSGGGINGERGLFEELADCLLCAGEIDAIGDVIPRGVEVGDTRPRALVRVRCAPMQTAAFLRSLGPDDIGLCMFGMRNGLPENVRCAVDLAALENFESARLLRTLTSRPVYGGNARKTRMAEWFKTAPQLGPPQKPSVPDVIDEATWGCRALVESANVRRGVFVTSEGRTSTSWLSLRDVAQSLREAGPDAERLVQRAAGTLLERLKSEWERAHRDVRGTARGDRASGHQARRFVVLNLCSAQSGICNEFSLFHSLADWGQQDYSWFELAGNIALSAGRVAVEEQKIQGAIADGSCDTVLFVPFDTYEGEIQHVSRFVQEDPTNRVLAIFALFSLPPSHIARASTVGAEIIPLARWDGVRLSELQALDDVLMLHPWIIGGEPR